MSTSYFTKNHSKFYLKIHLVLVCKYRKKLLSDEKVNSDIKKILKYVEKESDFEIDIMETDKDHIHILINISPKVAISTIVARIKRFSTYYIFRRHQKLKWLKKFWSRGYFVCSIGEASPETIRKYIETQG
jgi:putative transposase